MNKIDQIIEILDNNDVTHYFPMANINKIAQRIAALYSSQEPKVVPCKFEDWDDTQEPAICQCTLVDDFDTSNRCGHIGDVTDCPLYKPVSQSVSTPTEGMELSEIEAREISLKVMADYAAWIGNNHPALAYKIGELEREISKATVAKVLSNLPTEQEIRESERKEIGEWLEKVIAHAKDLNWADKADLNKGIDKLESGQSPKEG